MTGSFRTLAFPLFSALVILSPLLLVGAGVLVTMAFVRATPRRRHAGIQAVIIASCFGLIDVLLLKALPWLGLSFGPAAFSLVFLLGGRLILYLLWAVLLIRSSRSDRDVPMLPFWLVNGIATALVVYGFYVEPFRIQVSALQIPVDGLSRPVRIVQLSDVHVERTTRREMELVSMVRELNPDLIVLTGDYLNLSYLGDPTARRDAQALFGQLEAPLGIYAVSGSVDDEERMRAIFEGTRVVTLEDDVETLSLPGARLALIGVNNWQRKRDAAALARLVKEEAPPDAFRLLLYHTPDLIHEAQAAGVDLYLAGHTHGGQICAPFYGAIVTASMYGKSYESGRYEEGGTTLYVSRGIGMEGGPAPRARFLSPPEVVVIDLIPD